MFAVNAIVDSLMTQTRDESFENNLGRTQLTSSVDFPIHIDLLQDRFTNECFAPKRARNVYTALVIVPDLEFSGVFVPFSI